MNKINLKGNPFYLNDSDIEWIEDTIKNMTLEEKIGQLFCPIGMVPDEAYLKNALLSKHIGGILFRSGESKEMQRIHNFLQENSKIPLLIAANLEAGGDGIAVDGTAFGRQMQIAATNNPEFAYKLGKVSCSEGEATGCNWTFAPVVDVDMNFRNPITNVRTYGNNPDVVLENALNYLKAAKESNVAVSIKHFPGDGVDERDQHLATSVNTLSCEEWDKTFGKIYKGLIEAGALTTMIGHIAMPAYQKALNENFEDKIVPATLSKELVTGLLREKLNFNGMIVTDATPMVGFTSAMKREIAVPTSIAIGCDMFLFNKEFDEDYEYMMNGYKNGIISEERLEEALVRILATKAALKLHDKKSNNTLIKNEENLEVISCEKHLEWAYDCADKSITLVKDTQKILPINSNKYKKVLLQILGDFPSNDRVYANFKKELEKNNFEVIDYLKESIDDLFIRKNTVNEFKEKYDLVIYIGNIENASNKTVSRINWYTLFGLGNNIPWFVNEIPTLFVSLGNPYHLLDVPMIKSYINCYSNNNFVIEKVVEKLVGNSEFKGISPIDPFCDREDTKY